MIPDRSFQELWPIARLDLLTSLCIVQVRYCSSPRTIKHLTLSSAVFIRMYLPRFARFIAAAFHAVSNLVDAAPYVRQRKGSDATVVNPCNPRIQ
jgi:hypothetical protein